MLAPLIKRAGRSAPQRAGERGVTMALVAISMVAIISFAALAIDLGSLYEAKDEAQRAADAAALTAAQVISVSGLTGDPTNVDGNWTLICGTSGTATLAAQTVANQNLVGGKAPSTVTILYGAGGSVPNQSDCSGAGSSFGINPTVSVYVQQASLPTFFSHVFGLVGGTGSNSGVSATAYAEAFNSSDSNNGIPTPVQPRCVKPIVIPNLDPRHPLGCGAGNTCTTLVTPSTGAITSPGMYSSSNLNVIGERFFLMPDCTKGVTTGCDLIPGNNPPGTSTYGVFYVPGQTSTVFVPVALPTTGTTCASVASPYAQAVAGCDESTVYYCGVQKGSNNNYSVDLTENPATQDTQNAVQCLINQSNNDLSSASGQDTLGAYNQGAPPAYPFQIQAGSANPITTAGIASGSQITNSSSIVSIPIYDQKTSPITAYVATNVTIVGFLQVFINGTIMNNPNNNPNQGVDVTVLNVVGCGNAALTSTAVAQGTSPVPVRLISPP